jgi:phasin family protein
MASPPQSMTDFGECGNLFADMKHPDMPAIMEVFAGATRLNLATLTTTKRIGRECAGVVARRHMEILQQSMAELIGAVQSMSSHGPQANGTKQVELLKASERGASSMKELSDLIQHSNDEAVTLLNARVDALSTTLLVTQNMADHLILQAPV